MQVSHPHLSQIESQFWSRVDALEPGLDRMEFRRLVLGLVFLRYLDEAFAERRAWLARESGDARSVYFCLDADRDQLLNRPDAYRAAGVAFIVPAARWHRLRSAASLGASSLGRSVDATLISVVSHNPDLEGVFPADYSRPELSRPALAEAISAVSDISLPSAQDARLSLSTPDALRILCERYVAEITAAPDHNRLRVRTPVPFSNPEYSNTINRLDEQLRELSRLLSRRPGRARGEESSD